MGQYFTGVSNNMKQKLMTVQTSNVSSKQVMDYVRKQIVCFKTSNLLKKNDKNKLFKKNQKILGLMNVFLLTRCGIA